MTEYISSLTLQAFRGIPGAFTLDLERGRSCILLGDNGTGKSTIADAVEWYFQGRIEFLTKEGRSDAIRHSGAPEELETQVAISTDGSLGGKITPSVPSPQTVRDIGRSELFLLRGRTLADFVDKTKGEKWKALSELLGLDAIDQMRLDLQHAKNDLETQARRAEDELSQRRSALTKMVPDVSEQGMLGAIKAKCEVADVQAPASLDEALDPQWKQAVVPAGSKDQRAVTLVTTLRELRTNAEQATPLDPIDEWNQFIDGNKETQPPVDFYRSADSLLRSGQAQPGVCPLCGQSVDLQTLAGSVAAVLHGLKEAEHEMRMAQRKTRQFIDGLRNQGQRRLSILTRAREQGVELVDLPQVPHDALTECVAAASKIDLEAAEQCQRQLGVWDASALKAIQSAIPAPATDREQALVDLGVLLTEAAAWRVASRCERETNAAYALADRIFTQFQDRQHRYFSGIIQEISGRVAEIYQALHPEGGIGAVAIKTVGETGAELSVDFHGRTELPPHRVLSESHLNSLGIALFLAMAETLNEALGFLVLDDVVNSFDREHRGRLAELLVREFEGTQLIVLTHDEQFFTRMSRLAPSWIQERFTSWSYRDGPRTSRYEGDRMLTEATQALDAGDRIGAAQKGRRALEEFLQEACEELEALLPFRRGQSNDRRPAEEVMKGLRRTLRDRARDLYANEISPLLDTLDAHLQAGLNVEAHASQTSTSTQEVGDALARIAELRARFTCGACGTRVWHTGSPDASRCNCGKAQFPPVPQLVGSAAQQSQP